jgi:hypothetical protein
VILADTSAWIEFLRDTESPACNLVDELLDGDLATCEVVQMEVLSGARDETHLRGLRQSLARATLLPIHRTDYDDAAALYRRCRRQGSTVRSLLDCLVAAVAIRAGTPVLHGDRDFDALARHTELEIYRG